MEFSWNWEFNMDSQKMEILLLKQEPKSMKAFELPGTVSPETLQTIKTNLEEFINNG